MEPLTRMASEIISASQSLTAYVAEKLYTHERRGIDLSHVTVVFPGRRPRLYLLRELSRAFGRPFLPPRIFDIDSFMLFLAQQRHGPRQRVEPEELIYLMFKVTSSNEINLSVARRFDQFFFWGGDLVDVFDEFGVHLIRPEDIARAIPFALEEHGLGNQARGIWPHLPQIYKGWIELLEKQKVWSRGEIYRLAAKSVKERFNLQAPVYICGFVAPNKAEETVFSALFDRGLTKIILQYPDLSPEGLIERVRFYKTTDIHSQVKVARKILLDGDEGTKESCPDPRDLAIVLPRPDPLVPVLNWVIEDMDRPFNISMGYPLEMTPGARFIERVLRAQESRQDDRYYLPDYFSVLTHPFLRLKDLLGLVYGLKRHLSKARVSHLSLQELEDVAKGLEGSSEKDLNTLFKIHGLFFRSFEEIKDLSGLSNALLDVFSFLLEHGPISLHPLSGEFVGTLVRLLERVSRSPMSSEPGDLLGLIYMLRHLVRRTRIPFHGSPLEGIQVLGFLETRCLCFRKVVLFDMTEGVFPPESSPDPLVPPALRRVLDLPELSKTAEISKEHLLRLLSGAKEIHILFQEGHGYSKSRFVEELIWQMERHARKRDVANIICYTQHLYPRSHTAEVLGEKDEKLLRFLHSKTYSATSLDTYLMCPFMFFLSYCVGLDEADSIAGKDMDPVWVGDVIHKTLQRLYGPYIGKWLTWDEEQVEHFNRLLSKELTHVLEQKLLPYRQLSGALVLLKEVILLRLGHLFRLEKDLGHRKIIALEQRHLGSIELGHGRYARLQGFIDRIDLDHEANFWIIDYKTGATAKVPQNMKVKGPVQWDRKSIGSMIGSFQLPLYIYLYSQKKGMGKKDMAGLKACLFRLWGLGRTSTANDLVAMLPQKGKELEEAMHLIYLPAIKGVLCEILDPDRPFWPDPLDPRICSTCSYFNNICSGSVTR